MEIPEIPTQQSQLKKLTTNLNLLANFCAKYEFPGDVANLSITTDSAVVVLNVGFSTADRLAVLQLAGEVLGRNGWEKKPDWNKDFYDWSKTVDGVRVLMPRAEKIPDIVPQPVMPAEFPLQLQDTVAEGLASSKNIF